MIKYNRGGDSKNVGKHCTGATVLGDPFATEAKDTEAIRACNSVREHLDSPHQETVSSACTPVNKETGT